METKADDLTKLEVYSALGWDISLPKTYSPGAIYVIAPNHVRWGNEKIQRVLDSEFSGERRTVRMARIAKDIIASIDGRYLFNNPEQ